nr:MAG TPA_asm: hypothetical protein [Caudoviricetes sp.]
MPKTKQQGRKKASRQSSLEALYSIIRNRPIALLSTSNNNERGGSGRDS